MFVIAAEVSAPVRVGLWGCGNIGWQVAEEVAAGRGGSAKIVGVWARQRSARLVETAALVSATPCTSLDDLLGLGPDLVLEAASAAGLAAHGPEILEAGADLVALSPSCLFEAATEARFREAVARSGRRLIVPAASAAGLDQLLANRDELRSVRLTITWPPSAVPPLANDTGEVQTVFRGTARDAGRFNPHMLNFVVTIAFAGVGLDRTEVTILVDPKVRQTAYRLEIDSPTTGMVADVELRRPEGRRGRTAALSAVAALREMSGG